MTTPIHKRGRYSATIKKQVIKEAMSGEKTIAQIASDFGISPETVKDWKKQAWEAIEDSLNRKGRRTELERKDARIASLERLLGQREFELDWLSKKGSFLNLVGFHRGFVNQITMDKSFKSCTVPPQKQHRR